MLQVSFDLRDFLREYRTRPATFRAYAIENAEVTPFARTDEVRERDIEPVQPSELPMEWESSREESADEMDTEFGIDTMEVDDTNHNNSGEDEDDDDGDSTDFLALPRMNKKHAAAKPIVYNAAPLLPVAGPVPRRLVITPGMQCVQCASRVAMPGKATCFKCKRICIACKVNPCQGRRKVCYDCIFKEGAHAPICPLCHYPALEDRPGDNGRICINCYRKINENKPRTRSATKGKKRND